MRMCIAGVMSTFIGYVYVCEIMSYVYTHRNL